MSAMQSWSDLFWKYVRRGHDRSDAAYRADQWETRRKRDGRNDPVCCSTHCERAEECRTPHDCCGDFPIAARLEGGK